MTTLVKVFTGREVMEVMAVVIPFRSCEYNSTSFFVLQMKKKNVSPQTRGATVDYAHEYVRATVLEEGD